MVPVTGTSSGSVLRTSSRSGLGSPRPISYGSGNGEALGSSSSSAREFDFVEICFRNRYVRYNEVLGKGAFKTVYKAFDQVEGIEVAWNRMKISDKLQSNDFDKLYSEVRLLQQLKHTNIIKLYDAWVDDKKKTVNMITELFTSGSLRQFRKKHRSVDMKAIKNWARQILRGLDYLHSQSPPVIHRDLKCDNIFVNGNQGEVKLGDLGLAIIMQQPTAKSVNGTPEFMAPELYEEEYNELVDIYSFGMCLLEMVTMEYPYSECKNPAQIYKKVSSGILPASLGKVDSSDVKEFIQKCLVPAPQRLSARELIKDPFLQSESLDALTMLDTVPRYVCSMNYGPNFMDEEPEYNHQYAYTDSNGGTPNASVLEFRQIHHNTEFRLKGNKNDDNSISLTLIINADKGGKGDSARFRFYPDTDTALAVAAEMAMQLGLPDHDVIFIAEFIDCMILRILHGWKPSSDYFATTRSNLYGHPRPSISLASSPYFAMRLNKSSLGSSNSDFMRDLASRKTAMGSCCTLSEMEFPDQRHYDECRTNETTGSVVTAGWPSMGRLTVNSGSKFSYQKASITRSFASCCSSMNLLEKDPDGCLKLELDAIEAQYQQWLQELARMKREAVETAKGRWMSK